MSGPGHLRLFYLLHLSKPASDRVIYREIRQQKPLRIVELGIGTGERAERMIQVLGEFHPPREMHYVGIDLFEARSAADGPGVSLREAHRLLKTTGARIQLVPGTAGEALSRVANGLSQIDTVVVSSRIPPEQLAQVWFYLPRMIHSGTQVFQETASSGGNLSMRILAASEVRQLASASRRRAA